MTKKSGIWALAIALIVLSVGFRWTNHPANFTPILAVALFAGAIFPKPWMAGLVLFASMLISDAFIGFHSLIPITYLALAVLVFWGRSLTPGNRQAVTVGTRLGGGAIFFFLFTNLAVWWSSGMYSKDLPGLMECYTMAFPFFRNTLLSTWIFGGALFAAWELAGRRGFRLQKASPTLPR